MFQTSPKTKATQNVSKLHKTGTKYDLQVTMTEYIKTSTSSCTTVDLYMCRPHMTTF